MAEMVLGVIKVILTNIPENQRVTIFQGGFDDWLKVKDTKGWGK
ncbi:hypothetical protein ACLUXD_01880 [Loigolactobacillus coryniformis subsp. coryniformis]